MSSTLIQKGKVTSVWFVINIPQRRKIIKLEKLVIYGGVNKVDFFLQKFNKCHLQGCLCEKLSSFLYNAGTKIKKTLESDQHVQK